MEATLKKRAFACPQDLGACDCSTVADGVFFQIDLLQHSTLYVVMFGAVAITAMTVVAKKN